MSEPILYIDYDRTLFDTDLFNSTVWRLLASHAGVDADLEMRRGADYYVFNNDLYHYDFYSHLSDLSLDTADIITWLETELRKHDFLFPDADEALKAAGKKYRVEILTYGDRRYQKLKLQSCPRVDGYVSHIVLQPKLVFFESHPEEAVLVDDKLLAGQLPPHVRFIHLNRNQAADRTVHAAPNEYVSINSLTVLEKVI